MANFLYQGDLPDDLDLGNAVAIDCETMGLNPHRDRLCLIQMSSGDGNCHLVQVAIGQTEAPNLVKMLTDPKVLKLFHFGRFDIAALFHTFGATTAPVYCTKIASRMVRTFTDRHGLKNLLQELLDVDISKHQRRAHRDGASLLRFPPHPCKARYCRMARNGHLRAFMSDKATYLATARRVIKEEATGLTKLAEGLGQGFADAVDLILNAKGRVIVSGIGKSGHIARKVAATLASTGTPAQFVHPAEASHGDLGMVTSQDIVLAVSNSGEAPELANLVAYTRRFGISLIALSSREGSTLATQSDIRINIPALGEACGHGVVPTTSTTMSLAVGDALAITLMEARAFTPEDFRAFHPGGKLGAQLSKVADLMHSGKELPLVKQDTPMGDTLLMISQKGFGVVGVVDGNDYLLGIITDGDLRRHMDGLLDQTAGNVMTKDPTTITPNALAEEALSVMNDRKITCLFALDTDSKVKGILHIHDCLRAGLG